MSIALEQSGSGLYQIVSGRFAGLSNADDDTAIADNYLADMSNLRCTDFGTLKSVPVPLVYAATLPEPRTWIQSISQPLLLYIGMGGYCYGQVGLVGEGMTAVASDVDGGHLIAVTGLRLSTSWNGGVSWTERRPAGDVDLEWWAVASDGDGSHLIAAVDGGRLYTSSDAGVSWVERRPAGDNDMFWWSVASDADGSNLIAAADYDRIYVSADSGATWTEKRPAGDADFYWWSVVMDADGSNLIAAANPGRLYTSANGGTTWTERKPAGDADKDWWTAASDTDGSVLIVAINPGRLYTSADSGATWTERKPAGDVDANWQAVTADATGANLLAETLDGTVYASDDTGATWTVGSPAGTAKLFDDYDGLAGFKFVRYLGKWYTFTRDSGLYNGIDGTNISLLNDDYGLVINRECNAICTYEARLWVAFGNILRGSGKASDPESVDAVNGNRQVWGAWTGPNAQIEIQFTDDLAITNLFNMTSGLYIFTNDHVYTLAQFWGGTVNCLYQGRNLPSPAVRGFPMCDGAAIYYARDKAFYQFVTEPTVISSVLALDTKAYYVADYDHRLWFLVSSNPVPAGREINYLYALNKTTGSWEKYDIQLTAYDPAAGIYDTLTAMVEGPRTGAAGNDDLMLGTSLGQIIRWQSDQVETASLPWTILTKAFSPTFDQPHTPVKFVIDYMSQSTVSSVVVTVYIDGERMPTTIRFDMASGLGGVFKHREFDIPSNKTANTVQFKLEGTGKAEILSVGYSLSIVSVGDVNP
jgi:photosystem II stability/assembly factor-like uncharacterized protein